MIGYDLGSFMLSLYDQFLQQCLFIRLGFCIIVDDYNFCCLYFELCDDKILFIMRLWFLCSKSVFINLFICYLLEFSFLCFIKFDIYSLS